MIPYVVQIKCHQKLHDFKILLTSQNVKLGRRFSQIYTDNINVHELKHPDNLRSSASKKEIPVGLNQNLQIFQRIGNTAMDVAKLPVRLSKGHSGRLEHLSR